MLNDLEAHKLKLENESLRQQVRDLCRENNDLSRTIGKLLKAAKCEEFADKFIRGVKR